VGKLTAKEVHTIKIATRQCEMKKKPFGFERQVYKLINMRKKLKNMLGFYLRVYTASQLRGTTLSSSPL
jgi:hypothetical protein